MRSLRQLLAIALALIVAPALLAAQKPHRSLRQAIAAADSLADSSNFHVEFGSDINVTQTGDSLPSSYRLGLLVGKTLTLEPAFSAKTRDAGLEAEGSFAVTAAIFPGATNMHGQFVDGGVVYHRDPIGSFQWGVRFGTGTRLQAINGIAARTGGFVEYLFSHGGLPTSTRVGGFVGISFWR